MLMSSVAICSVERCNEKKKKKKIPGGVSKVLTGSVNVFCNQWSIMISACTTYAHFEVSAGFKRTSFQNSIHVKCAHAFTVL